ncbi:microtubule-associated tumor suppressor candidate 2 isoform X1 [Ahaetulla prasina]|uniref:microtubule-associated tumor suppressor candidate 2 isoform X1 n=1 Tax=Ahaetulla prasina TaxID=499056 RepID=UPI00264852E5|nr:microtubule-associated tumor suppressor candidate 2 isoform X1 [Ahaetulla prasina]
MSAPLVPNKSCYNLLQTNRNEMKNNNERMVSVGDTNANQITSDVRTPGTAIRTRNISGESACLHTSKQETSRQLDSERNNFQGITGESEFILSSAISKKLHADCRPEGLKDTSKLVTISRGHSLSNLKINTSDNFSVVLSKSDADLIQYVSKEKTLRSIEPEGIKRLSLGRSRKLMAKTEKEFVGRVSGKRLLSVSLDSINTSHHLSGDIEKTQKTSRDRFLGMVFHPTDGVSEGKIIPYSKYSSTSEMERASAPAIQSGVDNVPNANKQGPPHHAVLDLHLTVKSNELRKSEAQIDHQSDKRGKGEVKCPLSSQSKRVGEQKINKVMLFEFIGCPAEENNVVVQNQKDMGTEIHKTKLHQLPKEDLFLNEGFDSVNGSLIREKGSPDLRKGNNYSNSKAASKANGEYRAVKEVDYISAPDDDTIHVNKLTPTRNENLHIGNTSYIPAVNGHTSFTDSFNVTDSKQLNNYENKQTLFKGPSEDVIIVQSDLEAPKPQNTENISVNFSIVDSDLEATNFPVQSKKIVHEKKELSNNALESCKKIAQSEPFLCPTTPLRPSATMNASSHSTVSNSSLKEFCALHVDKLPSSATLPPTESTQLFSLSPKVPNKTTCNSGIPKPILINSKGPLPSSYNGENEDMEKPEDKVETPAIPKPKHVRPKIITYIRRNPQAISQLDQSGLSCMPPACGLATEQKMLNDGDIKPGNVFYEKIKTDFQKPQIYSSGFVVSGIKSSDHQFGPMGEKFFQEVGDRPVKDNFCPPPYAHYEVPPSFYRSTMILKPQLGLGAVSRLPSVKSRILISSQRSSASCIHPQAPIPSSTLFHPDTSVDLKKGPSPNATKSNLPKPCQSGLRPPGYSRLPPAKLATFGFVRSSSVSSISSKSQVQSDQSKTANRSSLGNEEQIILKAAEPSKDALKGANRTSLQASNSTPIARRSLLPAPKTGTAPAGPKKEGQKDQESSRPIISSPKRLVVAATKLHSPGHPKQKSSSVPRNGFSAKPDLQTREPERQFIQQMKDRCDELVRKFNCVQEELKRTRCGFDVFVITTQFFFQKNESAFVKEKEISAELANVKDEVALNTGKYETLQKEKEEMEKKFEGTVQKLTWQQQEELLALEERLQLQYSAELEHLRENHQVKLERLKSQHQEQVDDIAATQEVAILEMENNHAIAITQLQEEYEHKIQEMNSAHEQEKRELEENFEKLRLSLQDQVDTLTFQSQSLKDKAKRFEEALKKNTEEQLEVALAPYQHLEEDMKSLKQILEMKNVLIHQQEKRIMELERLAEKNLILEEKIQVLQQQNEDLKVRIDNNTVVTRQLSEENANLQEYVEKESKEKKRLSRTNEELLWKLQTSEPMSPVKLSPTSPTRIYRSSSGPPTPAKVSTVPR